MSAQQDIAKTPSSLHWYLLLGIGDLIGLVAFWFYWHCNLQLPIPTFVGSALLVLITTSLAAAPLIRFVILDWEVRYHEFLNRLNNESLIAYLQQFWEKRTTQDPEFASWPLEGNENIVTKSQPSASNNTETLPQPLEERIFDAIYHEQYGRPAFFVPITLLVSSIFISTVLSILIYLQQITLVMNIDAAVAIASIAGAYMYVVSDSIQSVRQRSLNASSIYWYVLRMLLAIPIGVALTSLAATDVKPFVAFGLGALPMDQLIKALRRLTTEKLNLTVAEEESDQLIRLEGVTGRIASMLIAEGVDSIEQVITVDPVLLSIRTGLPFKFILHLGSQAIVRRHLGVSAEKLIALGLSDARSIAALVDNLDDSNELVQNRAKAVLAVATSLIKSPMENQSATITDDYSTECLEYNFRQISSGNYTRFIQGKLLQLN
jgi:hypothetical protein